MQRLETSLVIQHCDLKTGNLNPQHHFFEFLFGALPIQIYLREKIKNVQMGTHEGLDTKYITHICEK
jgi:hypothetical protein